MVVGLGNAAEHVLGRGGGVPVEAGTVFFLGLGRERRGSQEGERDQVFVHENLQCRAMGWGEQRAVGDGTGLRLTHI